MVCRLGWSQQAATSRPLWPHGFFWVFLWFFFDSATSRRRSSNKPQHSVPAGSARPTRRGSGEVCLSCPALGLVADVNLPWRRYMHTVISIYERTYLLTYAHTCMCATVVYPAPLSSKQATGAVLIWAASGSVLGPQRPGVQHTQERWYPLNQCMVFTIFFLYMDSHQN